MYISYYERGTHLWTHRGTFTSSVLATKSENLSSSADNIFMPSFSVTMKARNYRQEN
jgi:hypothetical protein